ncbi:MAG: hypothetical protein D3915_00160 [Candidatus Electrothrix sp. AU1_5]|nr:hypothetical protein [Candidatus Electrothrix gigas]MCI5191533.1 hypothetical protein [Candidatus Electrothrix gigas]
MYPDFVTVHIIPILNRAGYLSRDNSIKCNIAAKIFPKSPRILHAEFTAFFDWLYNAIVEQPRRSEEHSLPTMFVIKWRHGEKLVPKHWFT